MSAALHDIKQWAPAPAKPAQTALQYRAARLWPDSEVNQQKWLRAVALVRSTSRGWLLDCPKRKDTRHA